MKEKIITLIIIFICIQYANAQEGQVVIGSQDDPKDGVVLELYSSDKGLLIPRVELTSRSLTNPLSANIPEGTVIFNTKKLGAFPNEIFPGFYWWDKASNQWNPLAQSVENYSAKYFNTTYGRGSTNFYSDNYIGVPVFASNEFQDRSGIYEIVSGSSIAINYTGLYSITINLDLETAQTNPIAIEVRLLKNGVPFGTRRYAQSQRTEDYFSENFTEYFEVENEGDIISIEAKATPYRLATGSTYWISFSKAGTSTATLYRIR